MILIDTNVISELMRPTPAPAVIAFLRAQTLADVFTSSLCEAEILDVIGIVQIQKQAHVAAGYATARTAREAIGQPVTSPDSLIAGTALAYGATIATRNVGDFAHCGVQVVDPWQGP